MSSGPAGRFYVTTPIYYVNAPPHVGSAYTTIAADVLARFHRLLGERVFFLTGADEHGQKNLDSARKLGITPQQYVDRMSAEFRSVFEQMHCRFDRFIRTSEAEHVRVVQQVFDRLRASGDIYRGEYEGWYCVPCETYLLEKDLADGSCPECKRPVSRVTTEAYFFRTSKYAEALVREIEQRPESLGPESRRNEVLAFVRQGLHDACISRKALEWDIPVPDDPDQTIYVWFDALVNYLTGAGYLQDEARLAEWWPPNVQLMAKDILVRFHGTIWPAMLMALGLPLPERIFAHGYLLTADDGPADASGPRKISKSRGDLVSPLETARQLADVSGAALDVAVDAVRYFLLREITFGLDGVFKFDAVVQRFNDDLANDLGNLLNRTLPLVERFTGGKVPEPGPAAGGLEETIDRAREQLAQAMIRVDFGGALAAIWQVLSAANRSIDERAPWDLHKAGKTVELDATLYDMLDTLRVVAIMVAPFMPAVAEEIWGQLGLSDFEGTARWSQCAAGRLPWGGTIRRGGPIFPRIDRRRAQARLDSRPPKEPPKERAVSEKPAEIDITDFAKLDLRVVEVLAAQRVPGKDRLLQLEVNLGEETRTVVAGIAPQFPPEGLVGKRLVLVANLKPATIGGVRSHGMVLAAGGERPLALVTLDGECPLGEKVR